MLGTVYYILLNMSIAASLVGLLITALGKVKCIPRFAVYVLWSVVLVRLIFPFALSSRFSILNFTGRLVKKVVEVPVPTPAKDSMELTLANSIGTAKSYFPVTHKSAVFGTVFNTAALIWIIGTAASILTVIILYYLTGSELKKASLYRDNVYISDMIASPLVFGIFKQRIIIPSKLAEDKNQLKYVLMHENVHIARHDNLYRFVAVVTACIHWFNPFVWLFLKLFLTDMELSCDAKAVRNLSGNERKQYAGTLAELSTGQTVFMSTAFGKTKVRVRVLNVMSYRKLTTIAVVFSAIFIVAATLVLLTNPMK
ncbi:MAG TPA: M56 family metallopeptidase [Clostridia bacterium]|nr:M56 family metallopeptidase [Clostridia bacterium]